MCNQTKPLPAGAQKELTRLIEYRQGEAWKIMVAIDATVRSKYQHSGKIYRALVRLTDRLDAAHYDFKYVLKEKKHE